MSNPEKAPQYSAGGQHGGGLLPTAESGQQNPPPFEHESSAPPAYEQGSAELPGDEKPRAPPVPQNQDQHVHIAGSEKQQQQQQPYFPPPPVGEPQQQQAPQQPHLGGDEKHQQQQQYFPPPPPGPPPSQDQHQQSASHPNPLQGNPINAAQQQQQQHQEPHEPFDAQHPQQAQAQAQQNYNIPQYDPAHPTFAPPPTNEPVQQGTGAPGHGAAAPSHDAAALGHGTAALGHGTAALGHGTAALGHGTAAPGHSTAAPGHSTAAPGHGAAALGHGTAALGHGADTGNVSTFVPPEEQKKHGWSEKFSQLGIKAAAPINSLAHKFGSQSFLPETIDKECDKAASILKSFCKNGVYADPASSQVPTSTDPKAKETNDDIIDPTKEKPKQRVLVNIPPKVIAKAQGLAIFTTLRAGYAFSGATGSGILISRLPDGSWGPPSGIQVHSVGAGFMIGLDIYDCVCVINSREALNAFAKTRVALGSDLTVVAGPYGAGGAVEIGTAMEGRDGKKPKEAKDDEAPPQPPRPTEDNQNLKPEKDKKSNRRSLSASAFKPVFSYVKSRGFYAGIQVDGTVVVERKDANAAFYGERVSVEQIIRGQVPRQEGTNSMWPAGARNLLDVLKGAEVGSLKVKHGKDAVSPTTPTFGGPAANPSAPVASGGSGADATREQLPGYVDDGVHRPEVGDVKYR
ncbi:hypothetical protein FSARC_14021 [Fusarium sarcochroum]|uniref:Ysc84 actin-binding domain-containing protein n=1 Tax=Fusarium sarcochroum TaxID=1208366 RepID=A0A8H4SX64_9HYPO|nr:hypothetical protein FSARC_14021 [Fusarium sarcochroum]